MMSMQSDGLLGLSPNVDYKVNDEEVHLLVNELVKDGVISKAQFGVYLTTTNQDSKIHFGGYDK
jgi:hypothetical protein